MQERRYGEEAMQVAIAQANRGRAPGTLCDHCVMLVLERAP